ncbi:MAG: class I SAM-dependent methyltransferase [Ignavibacteria bacterium]
MQRNLLNLMLCPIDKKKLSLRVYKTENRKYSQDTVEEIMEGLLISASGFIYPIIAGVPRMQLDAFLEYGNLISVNFKEYDSVKNTLLESYEYIINQVIKKTKKTKKSFSQEWKIFKYEGDTTWGFTKDVRKKRFLEEIGVTENELAGKTLLDVGCGNGVLTNAIADYNVQTVGIDVSYSIERAFQNNDNSNAHFIQCDLQNPPFIAEFFDIVYSTGVIHHTNNTELSFSCISPLVKPKGRLYVWLYKPEKDLRHRAIVKIRKFTHRLPIWLQYPLYLTFLVPWGLLKERLRGKKLTWREQLINYFDVLSCEFRYEHTPEEVTIWYLKRNFNNLNVTIIEYLGFGMYGDKIP